VTGIMGAVDPTLLHQLLKKGHEHRASDVHFKVGQPPAFRVRGLLHYLQGDKLRPEHTRAIAEQIVIASGRTVDLDSTAELDTSFSVEGVGRYRVNIYRQRGSIAIALRSIPLDIPTFADLGLGPVAQQLAELERGLVLVVGAAGNGKSSTLAAMVGHINHTRRCHVVTIEDPIEFLHADDTSCISQREIGIDTGDFAHALRAALRQDPDVILVGEVRDEETMDIALKAAETGHLVLSTLHTPDATRTVGRVVSLAGDGLAEETRERLSGCLRGIIAQRLLPRADKQGLALACEILVVTGTVREALRRPEANPPLKELMEKGVHPYGMQTFEMHLRQLATEKVISVETAKGSGSF